VFSCRWEIVETRSSSDGRGEIVTNDEFQKTDLTRYVPYVAVTTLFVVAVPLLLAYGLSGPLLDLPFVVTMLLCTALSTLLGRVGARWWQSRSGSCDVVFDDLTLWGFLRRLRQQRCVLTHAESLSLTRSGSQSLSAQDHSRVLEKLARALETGDPYTHGHSDRVARHAYMVARTLKLPKQTCDKIRLAAALHDVGKLHTPRAILTEPGRLTDEQFEIIKRHPADGAAMVAELRDSELTAMVRHHHERIDGTGYPHRISADRIPVGARIIAVADTFDAITSRRPYRATRRHKDALAILRREAGSQLDERVVGAFITYYTGRRGIRRWMSLTSGVPSLADFSLAGLRGALSNAAVAAAVVVTGSAVLPGLELRTELPPQGTTVQTAVGAGTTGSGGGFTWSGTGNGVSTKSMHQGSGTTKGTKGHEDDGRPDGSAGAGATDDPAPQKPEDGSGQIDGNESDDEPSGPGGGDDSGSEEDNSGPGG
jgi:putative nucleotidyltransferase with HDIG domain